MHLGSDIFEFADSVEDLTASRGLVNDAARDAEFRCGEVTCGTKVDTVFRKGVIAYDEYYLETPWRSYGSRLDQFSEVKR